MKKNQNSLKILKMTETAILAAIIVLMGFTPVGFLKIGVVEITFLTIPVAIGAVVAGTASSTFLGFVFGVVSFIQCFTGSILGGMLMPVSVPYTIITCIVPRVLMGLLVGLIYQALSKTKINRYVSNVLSCFLACAFNTVFFMTFLLVLFGRSDAIVGLMERNNITNYIYFAAWFVGINALIEIIVCTLLSFSLSSVVIHFHPDGKTSKKAQNKRL